MRTHLRKIGNSKGILIPSALLAACNLQEEVELKQEGNRLVIEALQSPRKGWFDGYQAGAESEQEITDELMDEDTDEWAW
jgi:antitoxin MazE